MFDNWLTGFNLREYNPNIWRFFLFAIPLFSGMALFALLYNLYLIRLSYQEDFIGQMAGFFPLASGLVALPTGIFGDRIGRKPFLFGASICLTLSHLGLCFVTDDTLLLALSFLGGMAGGFVFVTFIPFLAENVVAERRGQAIAIWISVQALSRMIISLIGGTLPDLMSYFTGQSTALPEPFRYALLIGAGCSFISIFPLFGIRAQPTKPRTISDPQDPPLPIPWKPLTAFTTISAFRGLSMGLSYPFFNVYFQEELGAATATIGAIFFLSQIIGLPCTISAPAIVRRFGPLLTLIPLRALSAFALAGLGVWLNLPLVVALFFFIAAIESLTTPTEMAFAANTPSAYLGRMQSLRVTGFQCLSALGSIWAGTLIVQHGYFAAFGLAGVALLASTFVFFIAFGYHSKEEAHAP